MTGGLAPVPRYIPWALLACGHLAAPHLARSQDATLPCPHCGMEWGHEGAASFAGLRCLRYRRRWVVAQGPGMRQGAS